MSKLLNRCLVVAAVLLFHTTAEAGELKLSMQNGRVTLFAQAVPLRQILTEWGRVGQTKIVNVDKVPTTPLTLQLVDVPERQALEVLLRTVSGYMAAPRPVQVASASQYDRIMILATSSAPPAPAGRGAPGAMPSAINRTPIPPPRQVPPPNEIVSDDQVAEDDAGVEEGEEAEEEEEEQEVEEEMPVMPGPGLARPGQVVPNPSQRGEGEEPQTSSPRPGVIVSPPPPPPQPFRQRQPPNPPGA